MKSLLSWILFATYLNAVAQPMLPFVQDCFAHLFFWKEHLVHVHQGQVHHHHVAYEMAANAAQEKNQIPFGHFTFSFVKDILSAHILPHLSGLGITDFPAQTIPLRAWLLAFQEVFTEVIVPPPDRA